LDGKTRCSLIAACEICFTRHSTRVMNHTSHITHHITHPTSHITHHTSHITHHTSHITHHTSHITHHTSHITHHTSHMIHHTRLWWCCCCWCCCCRSCCCWRRQHQQRCPLVLYISTSTCRAPCIYSPAQPLAAASHPKKLPSRHLPLSRLPSAYVMQPWP
jgi:hypothetical protein